MSRRRSLAPGEGFAVPLFGAAEPAALELFAMAAPLPPQPPETAPCPACGGNPCPGCGATALALPNLSTTNPTTR